MGDSEKEEVEEEEKRETNRGRRGDTKRRSLCSRTRTVDENARWGRPRRNREQEQDENGGRVSEVEARARGAADRKGERKRPWDRRKRKEGAPRLSLSRTRVRARRAACRGCEKRRWWRPRRRWRRGNTAGRIRRDGKEVKRGGGGSVRSAKGEPSEAK